MEPFYILRWYKVKNFKIKDAFLFKEEIILGNQVKETLKTLHNYMI